MNGVTRSGQVHIFTYKCIEKNVFKKFLWKINQPEKLKLAWKHFRVVLIQTFEHIDHWGQDRVTMEGFFFLHIFFTYKYIEKKTCLKAFWGSVDFKVFENHDLKELGCVHNSWNHCGSILRLCKFKVLNIMIPRE